MKKWFAWLSGLNEEICVNDVLANISREADRLSEVIRQNKLQMQQIKQQMDSAEAEFDSLARENVRAESLRETLINAIVQDNIKPKS